MFSPRMARAKRQGLACYGQLSQNYVEGSGQKWVLCDPPPNDDLLGTPDIQSLSDLNNCFEIVSSMRMVPFGVKDVSRLAIAAAAPFAPLLLAVWTPEEPLMRLVKVLF